MQVYLKRLMCVIILSQDDENFWTNSMHNDSSITLHHILTELNLLQYEDAFYGYRCYMYDILDRFDTENLSMQELIDELTEEIPMKKPHARDLVRYLFSQQHHDSLVDRLAFVYAKQDAKQEKCDKKAQPKASASK